MTRRTATQARQRPTRRAQARGAEVPAAGGRMARGQRSADARVVGQDHDVRERREPVDLRCAGQRLEHALVAIDARPRASLP